MSGTGSLWFGWGRADAALSTDSIHLDDARDSLAAVRLCAMWNFNDVRYPARPKPGPRRYRGLHRVSWAGY